MQRMPPKTGYWYQIKSEWRYGLEIYVAKLLFDGLPIYETTAVSENGARNQINQYYTRLINER